MNKTNWVIKRILLGVIAQFFHIISIERGCEKNGKIKCYGFFT